MFWSGRRPTLSAAATVTSESELRWTFKAVASASAMGRAPVTTISSFCSARSGTAGVPPEVFCSVTDITGWLCAIAGAAMASVLIPASSASLFDVCIVSPVSAGGLRITQRQFDCVSVTL